MPQKTLMKKPKQIHQSTEKSYTSQITMLKHQIIEINQQLHR
jgi:hypothetical protein